MAQLPHKVMLITFHDLLFFPRRNNGAKFNATYYIHDQKIRLIGSVPTRMEFCGKTCRGTQPQQELSVQEFLREN